MFELAATDGQFTTTDQVTINVDAGDETVTIAYVAGNAVPPSGDRPIRDRMIAGGATVVVIDDDDAATTDCSSYDLIFVSTSVVISTIGELFKESIVPVMSTEHYLYDDNAMATAPINDLASATVDIVSPNHRLAAGYEGFAVGVTSSATSLGLGTPGPDAQIIATIEDRAVYFAYDAGAEMANGFLAPARRVAFPGTFATAKVGTTTYFQFLDAAIAYAIGG